jgi:7,8-dihydro-6-hydroxymethylpterin-pyrophosphokinase
MIASLSFNPCSLKGTTKTPASDQQRNQQFINSVLNAKTSDEIAAVIQTGKQLRTEREPILQEYENFLVKIKAMCAKKRDIVSKSADAKAAFFRIQHDARNITIPNHDPADDYGLMTPLCEAAQNDDYPSMREIAANSAKQVQESKAESRHFHHAINIVKLLQTAATDEDHQKIYTAMATW